MKIDKLTTQSYKSMMKRCYEVGYHKYLTHGARGITVCDRWKGSYDNFLSDMGPRPSRDYTIERINNDKGYSLDNCRWATRLEQSYNRKNSRWKIYFYQNTKKYSKDELKDFDNIPELKKLFDVVREEYPLSRITNGIKFLNLHGDLVTYAFMVKEDKYSVNTGDKFGFLTAVKPKHLSKKGIVIWLCKCHCNELKLCRSDKLVEGRTKSCGCMQNVRN